ncbi:hypothetical protein O9929_00180 [Vibrio lentus]|nr:hypothetical protein [Vibrio lentus]
MIATLVYYLNRLKKSERASRKAKCCSSRYSIKVCNLWALLIKMGCCCRVTASCMSFTTKATSLELPFKNHQHWEESARDILEEYFTSKETPPALRFEAEVWCRDRGVMVLEISLKSMPGNEEDDTQFLFEGVMTSVNLLKNKTVPT